MNKKWIVLMALFAALVGFSAAAAEGESTGHDDDGQEMLQEEWDASQPDKRTWATGGAVLWGKRAPEPSTLKKWSAGTIWGKRALAAELRGMKKWQTGAVWGKRAVDEDSEPEDEQKRSWSQGVATWGKKKRSVNALP